MKSYNKDIESSYLNFYGWGISQKLTVNGYISNKKLSKFDEEFIKIYNEDSNKGYILETDNECPKNVLNFHGDLPFLPERKKIKKCNKLVYNMHDKQNYVVHLRAWKQALNRVLVLKKVQRIIQLNQIK